MKEQIMKMLDMADERRLRLIYRFVKAILGQENKEEKR